MNKIIVSLTSYPKRIKGVYHVIESLYKQTVPADEIILWLSREEFEEQQRSLPIELQGMLGRNGFKVEWVLGNLKSHKKYFYVLQRSKEDVVITVDDDVYYHSHMIEDLVTSYKEHPNAISARNVHVVLKDHGDLAHYDEWGWHVRRMRNQKRQDLCAIGVGGILYPPGCAAQRWFDTELINGMARNQDDLWLLYNEMLDAVPVVYIGGSQNDVLIEGSQDIGLSQSNVNGGENDKCLLKLSEWAKKTHTKQYNEWMQYLSDKMEYYENKKKEYKIKIEYLLSKNIDKEIYICGAGLYARVVLDLFDYCGEKARIRAFVVTDKTKNPKEIADIPVYCMDEIDCAAAGIVICGVGKKYRKELRMKIEHCRLGEWIDLEIEEIISYYRGEEIWTQ